MDHLGETNEKVDKRMTDNEINEQVARKLGWNLNKTGNIGVPPHRSMGFESIPDYCHSIAVAWEIVEKSKRCIVAKEADLKWGCELRMDVVVVNAIATTPSMAICLAFLKLP